MTQRTRRSIFKRWWFYFLLAAVLAAVLCIGILTGIVVNASKLDDPHPADVIIVLGAGIDEQGLPKPMLERRLNRALALYEAGYAQAIITTGAQGSDEPITEALSMMRYLADRGVPEASIHCEDASYNTKQNLAYAKIIMEERGYADALVVTSDYHLWRALSICRDLSIEASGAGAQNALTLRQAVINCLKETVSWVKYLLI